MKQFTIFCAFLVLMGCVEAKGQQTKIISSEEMKTLLQMEGVQLVDVRTPEEFSEGYIPNAINIDFFSPNFMEEMERLNKDNPVIVYCRSGKRSAKCSKLLEEAGFKKIYDLDGGYSKWKSQNK